MDATVGIVSSYVVFDQEGASSNSVHPGQKGVYKWARANAIGKSEVQDFAARTYRKTCTFSTG